MHHQAHLFLDRDGTLIREENYLRDPDKVELEEGVIEGLRDFVRAGYRLVVVSNQSGVGRGLLTEDDVAAVNAKVGSLLAAEEVLISSWHHCPHHPNQKCSCRKPAPGMFEAAAIIHPVDWTHSIMVGDKPSDIEAGIALGMRTALVTTGYGQQHREWALANNVIVVHSLAELAKVFVSKHFA